MLAAAASTGLVESHAWIVDHFRARYAHLGDAADLQEAGLLGLCVAADRYQPGRGGTFSTYAWNYVKGFMVAELRRAHVVPVPEHTARRALSRGEPLRGVVVFQERLGDAATREQLERAGLSKMEDELPQERVSETRMRLRLVRSCLPELDPALRKVIRRVLQGQTVEQIAKGLRLTRSRVEALVELATEELRGLCAS